MNRFEAVVLVWNGFRPSLYSGINTGFGVRQP